MYCLLPPPTLPCGPFCPGCEICCDLVFCDGEPQNANVLIGAQTVQVYDGKDCYANTIVQAIENVQKRTESLQRKLASMEKKGAIEKIKRTKLKNRDGRGSLSVHNKFAMDARSADPFESLESKTNYDASESDKEQKYYRTTNGKNQSQTRELPVLSSDVQANNSMDMMRLCLVMMGEMKVVCNELATVMNKCQSIESQSACKCSVPNINQRAGMQATTVDAPNLVSSTTINALPRTIIKTIPTTKAPIQCERTTSICSRTNCTMCCAKSISCCSKYNPVDFANQDHSSYNCCREPACEFCHNVSDQGQFCSKPRGSKCKCRCKCGKPCRTCCTCRKPNEECLCSGSNKRKTFFQTVVSCGRKSDNEKLQYRTLSSSCCRKSCCFRKARCARERNNYYISSYCPVRPDLTRRRYPKTRSVRRTWYCWPCL